MRGDNISYVYTQYSGIVNSYLIYYYSGLQIVSYIFILAKGIGIGIGLSVLSTILSMI